jgi:hypothetical protein
MVGLTVTSGLLLSMLSDARPRPLLLVCPPLADAGGAATSPLEPEGVDELAPPPLAPGPAAGAAAASAAAAGAAAASAAGPSSPAASAAATAACARLHCRK